MRTYIGIDIGGTSTKLAAIQQDGKISYLQRFTQSKEIQSADQFITHLESAIQTIFSQTPHCKPEGIGINIPGMQMENHHGTACSVNLPFLNHFDFVAHLSNRYHLPVIAQNDLVANALADAYFGAHRYANRFLSVAMGTGIGHTFIQHGEPVLSLYGVSGESGRMIIDETYPHADSSNIYGSAEAMCGVKAIERLAAEKFTDHTIKSAHEVIQRCREKQDPIAIDIMKTIFHRTAIYLINLSSIYFPDIISLSGGQTESGSELIQYCQTEFDKLSGGFFDLQKKTGKDTPKIVKSSLGGLAGLAGSIVQFLERKE